ncbi:MAG: hypothetical protein OEZ39_13795 [Gammaproteobacteria bacterium]|nr:hypothetical protein [Gammaproteobacteria bacterium]MDH5652924.1 hypothetical protein [Gammaproteobacteria bacterium]
MASNIFLIVPNPFLSGLIWFFVIISVMYLARTPAHMAIQALCRVIHNAMRLTARAVMRGEKKLAERNREVLAAQGRDAVERIIEREFERVDATVRRDLAEYPALHRELSEEITRIDEDYKQSTEVPPAPPGWIKAVEAVANIPAKDDPMVGGILDDIHSSLVKANNTAVEEYRKSSHKRHMYLKDMMPHWRKVLTALNHVDKNVNSLLDRAKVIDRHMDKYESIQQKTDSALRELSSSSMTQFFISAFVLLVAIGGALINFNLIALPMSEMVGAGSYIMGFKTSSIAAMVIILVEVAMGLFLMESMRITRLFPVIGALNDKLRVRMVWITLTLLTILATVEAGLAFMRDLLAQDNEATRAVLRGNVVEEVKNSHLWITTAAQMGLGFILPFALTFVAIPLESFVHSTRTVIGVSGVGFLHFLAWTLRLIGDLARFTSKSLISIYDLIIFAPLFIENMVKGRAAKKDGSKPHHRDAATSAF